MQSTCQPCLLSIIGCYHPLLHVSLIDSTVIVRVNVIVLAIVIVRHCCCHLVNIGINTPVIQGHSPLLLQLQMKNRCNMLRLLTNNTLVEERSVPEVRVGGFYKVGLGDHAISPSVGA